jgi:hypothetical protein
MIDKIIFYNHYHRGDLMTHRGFLIDLKLLLPSVKFEYLHFNHPKLTKDLDIPLVGNPRDIDEKIKFFKQDNVLYINTWIGAWPDVMKLHGGLNMFSLWNQWKEIYQYISNNINIVIAVNKNPEYYLPSIKFNSYDTSAVDQYLKESKNSLKVLLCNGPPKSKQSFNYNMESFITDLAKTYNDIHFICTEKFNTVQKNILFTDDIINEQDVCKNRAPWEDRIVNICDLPEISYLSEHCQIIVGKNSGPFVFCETKNNFFDTDKTFISFNVSWKMGTVDSESMSYNIPIKCKYVKIPIQQSKELTLLDESNIKNSLHTEVKNLRKKYVGITNTVSTR